MTGDGCDKIRLQTAKASYFSLIIFILLTISACGISLRPASFLFPEHTKFFQGPDGYGLQDIQLDDETYFIAYMDYGRNRRGSFEQKLLQVAQEYVLYRAGEIAKSRGAKYFAVLHNDDWEFFSQEKVRMGRAAYSYYPYYEPGAGIVMRLLYEYSSAVEPNDDHVYEVNTLLQQLPERNRALAKYLKQVPEESLIQIGSIGFRRWRSSVNDYDSLDAFERKYKSLYGTELRDVGVWNSTIETTIVPRTPSGQFEISISDMRLIAPLRLLVECVKLADQKGYEAFKVVDWTVEEHFVRRGGWRRYMWFRTKATIILQDHKEPESLEPVFVADEIRKAVEAGRLWPLDR